MTDDDGAIDQELDELILDEWVAQKYDEILARFPGGIAVGEVLELLRAEYRDAARAGAIPPPPPDEMDEAERKCWRDIGQMLARSQFKLGGA